MIALIQHPEDPCSVIEIYQGAGIKTEKFGSPEQAKAYITLCVGVCGGEVLTLDEYRKRCHGGQVP